MTRPTMPVSRCFFFGCWNEAGHYLYAPGGRTFWNDTLDHVGTCHIDGTLAPRMTPANQIVWVAQAAARAERQRLQYESEEMEQGQFLLHVLPNGFTAIQWWDRCQGDRRGGCNSTILLAGIHTAGEMIAAAREHFPHVLDNLARHGVELVEVKVEPKEKPA